MAIPAGPTGPFVLSLSKDRLRVFSLIEIANTRIEYGVAMTKLGTHELSPPDSHALLPLIPWFTNIQMAPPATRS